MLPECVVRRGNDEVDGERTLLATLDRERAFGARSMRLSSSLCMRYIKVSADSGFGDSRITRLATHGEADYCEVKLYHDPSLPPGVMVAG